jgi:hypothetical protein
MKINIKFKLNYFFDKIKTGAWFALPDNLLVLVKHLLFQTSSDLYFVLLR